MRTSLITTTTEPHFFFDLDDRTKTPISHEFGGIACCCLSPDSKVLAIAWNGCQIIDFYCTRTCRQYIDPCFDTSKVTDEITGLFFASSTGDTFGTVRNKHVYMDHCHIVARGRAHDVW